MTRGIANASVKSCRYNFWGLQQFWMQTWPVTTTAEVWSTRTARWQHLKVQPGLEAMLIKPEDAQIAAVDQIEPVTCTIHTQILGGGGGGESGDRIRYLKVVYFKILYSYITSNKPHSACWARAPAAWSATQCTCVAAMWQANCSVALLRPPCRMATIWGNTVISNAPLQVQKVHAPYFVRNYPSPSSTPKPNGGHNLKVLSHSKVTLLAVAALLYKLKVRWCTTIFGCTKYNFFQL